jgi:hypothetical protein
MPPETQGVQASARRGKGSTGKGQPQAIWSAEAEQTVLGGLMAFAEAGDAIKASKLHRDDFHDERHRLIWTAIDSVRGQGVEISVISVLEALRSVNADELAGGIKYLNDIARSVVSARHAISLSEIVKDKARRRRLEVIGKAIQQAAGGPLGADELRGRVDALADEMRRVGGPPELRPTIPVEWARDIPQQLNAPRQIVEGVLTAGSMSMFYGESNSGKSYLAIHLAISVSQGLPWLGRRTAKGAVLYVAAEGAWSIRLRLAAHRKHYGREIGHFGLIPSALSLVDPSGDVDELIALIHCKAAELGDSIALIVIDTVARVMGGGDENTAQDMGRLVQAGDRIRTTTGAHLLYIHHAGKDASRGARGHSSLRAALDTEIEVIGDEATKLHTAKVTKQRDLPSKGDQLAARFVSVELGQDQWDNPITACAVVEAEDGAKAGRAAHMTPSQRAVLGFLAGQHTGIRRAKLVEALTTQGLSRPSVYRAVNDLILCGLITDTVGLLYVVKE